MAHCVRQVRKTRYVQIFSSQKTKIFSMDGNISNEISADYVRSFSFSATELLTPDSIGVILVKVFGLSSFLYRI